MEHSLSPKGISVKYIGTLLGNRVDQPVEGELSQPRPFHPQLLSHSVQNFPEKKIPLQSYFFAFFSVKTFFQMYSTESFCRESPLHL